MGDLVHVPEETVKTVGDTGDALISPVVDHTERLTRVEGNLTATEERLNRQLLDTEQRLREAIDANAAQETIVKLEERIATLEARLEEKGTHPVETTETAAGDVAAAPEGAASFVVPEVEESTAPPEQERRSIRHKRKSKRGKK